MQFDHHVLTGPEALLAKANSWNDLWDRSTARQPAARAEGVAAWVTHFAGDRELLALCVEAEGQLVAAMPLIADHLRGVVPVYRLPVSCWANAGDLLVARDTELGPAVAAVVDGLGSLPGAIFSFDEITLGAPQWMELRKAIRQAGGRSCIADQWPVGVIDILGQWNAYEQSWSSNHRGGIKRTHRKLSKEGELRVQRHAAADAELERLMRLAFEIEDRSWKGEQGTSILKTPGMVDYMLEEAHLVAASGHADIWFLFFDDQPIAFEYCHFAKGTCFSHKIGYDPAYAKFGPGRLLRYMQLQAYHEEPECRLFDMLGRMCGTKAKWATRTYNVGRLHATIGSRLAGALLDGYAWAAPHIRKLRGRTPEEPHKLGATSYLDAVDEPIEALAVS